MDLNKMKRAAELGFTTRAADALEMITLIERQKAELRELRCPTCDGIGSIGRPPDEYWPCHDCTAQSQPVAPAVPVAVQHMAVAEDGELRWMTGRKIDNCELYAMPDFGKAPPLYLAPQPAAPDASKDRIIEAMATDLGLINEALGLDPDDGGADPILDAIEELQEKAAQPVAQAAVPPEKMTIESAREYLVSYMDKHFDNKTFTRYIMGADEYGLAGDFAYYLAYSLESTAPQSVAQAARAGWQWAPSEPTEAMQHAAEDVPAPRPYGAVYRAMLAAAPQATVPDAPIGYANGDDLDNMLDDRTCVITGKPDGMRKTALYAAPQAPQPQALTDADVQRLALANGFKLKEQPDGTIALNPYVFDFARALIAAAPQPQAVDELIAFEAWLVKRDPRPFCPAAFSEHACKWDAWSARAAMAAREAK